MAEDNLKSLPPEERIKKLKELEERKKKEIAEAERSIKESEGELTERRKWAEKVPIPQVARDDLGGSADEKLILQAHKGKTAKKKEEEGSESETVEDILDKRPADEKADLETLAQEKVDLPPELMGSQYTMQLSQKPMENLYQEMSGIKKAVDGKGYISQEEEKRIAYLSSAVEKKVEAAEEGKYSFTESVARAASLSRQMGSELRNLYQSSSGVKYQS